MSKVLEGFDLSDSDVTVRRLNALASWYTLEELNLANTRALQRTMAIYSLYSLNWSKLRTLNLSNTGLTSSGETKPTSLWPRGPDGRGGRAVLL